MSSTRFPKFRELIAGGASPLTDERLLLASNGHFSLVYTPFEHVTTTARLAIVGMTPGPGQLKLAYAKARGAIAIGRPEPGILKAVKEAAAFGGDLREPLLKMLRHFGIAHILGIGNKAELWSEQSSLLHATSIVPHAAFKDGTLWSGSRFAEVLKSPVLRQCFEEDFLPTLKQLDPACRFVGLGSLVGEGLEWCVDKGLLKPGQLLGNLPHPSSKGGNQVALFLKEIAVGDLKLTNPVRYRAERLARSYDDMMSKVALWRQETGPRFDAVVAADKDIKQRSERCPEHFH